VISRNWHCQNERCGHEFHSFDPANPPCPNCGCVRVSWVPGGGHIMGMAPRVDARLRAIADQHGFTNLNSASPSRLNRAAPRVEQKPISHEMGIRNFGPGFSAPVSAHGAICVPSSSSVDMRGKVQLNVKRDHSASIPGPEANAIVMARTRQRNAT
jgi:hypothetical protein